MSWSQPVDSVSRSRNSVRGSTITCMAHGTMEQNVLLEGSMGGSVSSAHGLEKTQLAEVGSDLSEAYREMKLRRLIRAELFLTLTFIGTSLASVMGAMNMPLLLIIAVFTAWFATILFRLYWHHLKCYKRMVKPKSQQCSRSSELPLVTGTKNDHAMEQQAAKKGCMVANQYSRL